LRDVYGDEVGCTDPHTAYPLRNAKDKSSLSGPDMTIAFSPVSTWRSRLLYELTRLYFICSGSFVVPKAPLCLYLLTGGASVRAPVPLFEQALGASF